MDSDWKVYYNEHEVKQGLLAFGGTIITGNKKEEGRRMRTKDRQQDRRVIRTKREILAALTELLEQKSIDEITVREITDLAGINRGTFYLHYVDKYDLMEKSVNSIITELQELGKDVLRMDHEDNDPDSERERVITSLTAIFRFVQENSRFIRSLLSEKSNYSFHHQFNAILKDALVERWESTNPSVPALYLAAAVTYAYQGLIHCWLTTGMKETPEEMAEYGYRLIYHSMVEIAQNEGL